MFWEVVVQPDIYIDQSPRIFAELQKMEIIFKDRILRDKNRGSKHIHFLRTVIDQDGNGTLRLQSPIFLPKAADNQHLQFTSGVEDITAIEQSTDYVYNAVGRPLLHGIGTENEQTTLQNMEALDHIVLSFTVVGIYEESLDTITAGIRLRPNQLVKIHGNDIPSVDRGAALQVIRFPINMPRSSASQDGQLVSQRAQDRHQQQTTMGARDLPRIQYLQDHQNLQEVQGQYQ